MNRERVYRHILELIDDVTYETEYDGHVYTRCKFCHVCVYDREHSKDCATVTSIGILNEEFGDLVAADKAIADAEEAQANEQYRKHTEEGLARLYKKKVTCVFCQELIEKHNLHHHVHSKTCKKTQRKLVEAGILSEVNNTPYTNIGASKTMANLTQKQVYESNKAAKVGETIHCPVCNTAMVKKTWHHNFCSGTNHKDRYWNAQPGRNVGRVRKPYYNMTSTANEAEAVTKE